jgi:hypothetical protein
MLHRAAAAPIVAAFLLFAVLPGCSKSRPAEADKHFTTLYAEFMLLNEQEKMTHPVPDSAYRAHAAALLGHYGVTEAEFRKRSDEMMKDDREWRDFLGRVSLVFDSIKTARAQQPK